MGSDAAEGYFAPFGHGSSHDKVLKAAIRPRDFETFIPGRELVSEALKLLR